MLDESTAFGARAAERLRENVIGWLTTVTTDGAPRPIPVWFLWDGDRELLLYSRPGKRKLANIEANPQSASTSTRTGSTRTSSSAGARRA